MTSLFNRIYLKYRETYWRYKKYKSNVRIQRGGIAEIDKTAQIRNSNIYVDSSSKLILRKEVRLEGVNFFLTNGAVVEIGEYSFVILDMNSIKPEIIVNNGSLFIGNHTKSACQRLWIRFGGKCKIGNYTNINSGSEIRADESVCIGNFCQISYNVRIWDTNTHCIYSQALRQKMTIDSFPSFGKEYEKPITRPVKIGNGCWLGEIVSILKGSELGDDVIVGFNTLISNKHIASKTSVVQHINLLTREL